VYGMASERASKGGVDWCLAAELMMVDVVSAAK